MTRIDELVSEYTRKQNAAIEDAAKRMLNSDTPVGVRVETWPDGRYEVSLSTETQPYVITWRQND